MKILDDTHAGMIADEVIETLDSYGGYTDEELVPGLIQAVIDVASRHDYTEQMLDEAVDFLANGGVEKDVGEEREDIID